MLEYVDGELSPAQELELMTFLDQHPELKAELDSFMQATLQPDEAVVYEDKAALYRTEAEAAAPITKGKIVHFKPYRYWTAAAAAAALLVSIAWWNINNRIGSVNERGTTVVAHQNTQAEPTTGKTTAPLQPAAPAAQPAAIASAAPVTHTTTAAPATVAQQAAPAARIENPPLEALTGKTQSIVASSITITPRPVDIAAMEALSAAETPALAVGKEAKILDLLPYSEEKKAGFEYLASRVANALDKSGKVRKELQDYAITVKLGNRTILDTNN